MNNLMFDNLNNLISQGSRTEWLEKWLLNEIWTFERYQELSPIKYLEDGESKINEIEEIIAHAAPRIYDEFLDETPRGKNLFDFFRGDETYALVIFDGLSLREIPVLINLAQKSNFSIKEMEISFSALPSETIDFIEQKLGLGNSAPSQLPNRKELKEKNISAYYYNNPNQQYQFDKDAKKLLLWSAFPDNTYNDSGARFSKHFEQIHKLLETAWMNSVQRIPHGQKIVITSDHGYVYFGPNLSFPRSNAELKPLSEYLGGERYKRLSDDGLSPPIHDDLLTFPNRKIAVIKGRVQTHPPGKSAGMLYKHGGLSIMEMLVPWIELQ